MHRGDICHNNSEIYDVPLRPILQRILDMSRAEGLKFIMSPMNFTNGFNRLKISQI
jgi:hypothetical protein